MPIIIALMLALLTGCQSGHYRGPISDHFDGQLFYNPEHPKRKTPFDIIKELISQQVAASCIPVSKSSPVTKFSTPNKVKITFINHSTVLIQTRQLNLLTDPIWSKKLIPFPMSPIRVRPPGITFNEIPPIDIILISHNHYDHLDFRTLKKLNNKFHPLILVPLGNKTFLEKNGIQHVVELDWWEKVKINKATITFLPAQHWSARWLTDGYQTLWGSYGIELENKKIYFAGDTGYSTHFKKIKLRWGKPDISFLPIGCYEPHNMVYFHHLNPREAIQAHQDLASKQSISIHYGTFALGCAAIYRPIIALHKARKAMHISENEFMILKEGVGREF